MGYNKYICACLTHYLCWTRGAELPAVEDGVVVEDEASGDTVPCKN